MTSERLSDYENGELSAYAQSHIVLKGRNVYNKKGFLLTRCYFIQKNLEEGLDFFIQVSQNLHDEFKVKDKPYWHDGKYLRGS